MAGTTQVLVGRIGKAHGLRGEVTVAPTTDSPEQRFAPGSQLSSPTAGRLTVRQQRWQAGTLVVAFEQAGDRSAAEALRGAELWTEIDAGDTDAGEFHDTSLIGLAAVDPSGGPRGRVVRVLHLPAQDVLVLDTPQGERLVPFVTELVPEVDLPGGRVVIDPIPGLLDEVSDAD
ncbi:MAG: ribosome maturation factor RimM [Propionibacteriaceae bacterium]|nr:ribosome maturation factor RimM [Propionibacteriaceae bacterium]